MKVWREQSHYTVHLGIARLIVAIILVVSLGFSQALAQEKSPSDVYVQGYYKKDGTYVKPHWRSAPNSTRADNFSTRGNVNPYTGEPGTKPQYPYSSSLKKQNSTGKVILVIAIAFFVLMALRRHSKRNKNQT